jgi:MFS family permease
VIYLVEKDIDTETIKSRVPNYNLNLFSIGAAFFGLSAFYTVESQFLNSYIIKVLNESAYLVALMVSFSAFGSLILFILAGAISDSLSNNKWGRRRPFAIGGIIAGICVILIPFQTTYFMVFFIDVVLLTIFGNMANAARKAAIPDIYPIETRGSVNGWMSLAEILGSAIIIGVSFLGLALLPITETKVGDQIIYSDAEPLHFLTLITAGFMTSVSCFIFYLCLREPKIEYEPIPWGIAIKNTFSVKELKQNKAFMKFMIITTLVQISSYTFNPYLMTFVMSSQINTLQVGLLLACYGAGSALPFRLFGIMLDKNPRKKITLIAVSLAGIGFCLVGIFGNLDNIGTLEVTMVCVGIFVGFFGYNGLVISQNTWSQDLFPIESRGKYAGIYNVVFTLSQIPGAFLGAWLFEAFGIQYVFLGAGIIAILFGQLYRFAEETYLKTETNQ